jgi:hypothetical protein
MLARTSESDGREQASLTDTRCTSQPRRHPALAAKVAHALVPALVGDMMSHLGSRVGRGKLQLVYRQVGVNACYILWALESVALLAPPVLGPLRPTTRLTEGQAGQTLLATRCRTARCCSEQIIRCRRLCETLTRRDPKSSPEVGDGQDRVSGLGMQHSLPLSTFRDSLLVTTAIGLIENIGILPRR